MVDISRSTTGVYLPAEVSDQVWQETLKGSVVMSLATQIPLAGPGSEIDLITADPVAPYVAEGAAKPVANATVGNKTL